MGRAEIRRATKLSQKEQPQTIEKAVKQLGLDPIELIKITQLMYSLADIQHTLSMSLSDKFKGSKLSLHDKSEFNTLKVITTHLSRTCDRDLMKGAREAGLTDSIWAEEHGKKCDYLREALNVLFDVNLDDLNFILNVVDIASSIPKEDHESCISTLKIYKQEQTRHTDTWNKTWCKNCAAPTLDKNLDMIDNGHNVQREVVCPKCGWEGKRKL